MIRRNPPRLGASAVEIQRETSSMKDQVPRLGSAAPNVGDLTTRYEDLISSGFQAYADAKIDPQDIQARTGHLHAGRRGGRRRSSLGDALRLSTARSRGSRTIAPPARRLRNCLLAIAPASTTARPWCRREKLKDAAAAACRASATRCWRRQLGARSLCAGRQCYMHTSASPRDARQDAVKNHYNGARNPKAHLRRRSPRTRC